ncbi:MAG: acyl-CoA thioesterase [Proteobacteria bacterium]|nr:acyl-CoA thioesterase [Pseudomonadota bacterium]
MDHLTSEDLSVSHNNKAPMTSDVIKTEWVIARDINAHGSLFGGTLLSWADVTAALSATKFSQRPVVTASLDAMSFLKPIKLGWIVTLQGRVNESFNTSMEVGVRITSLDPKTGHVYQNSRGYFTLVALDEHMKPIQVPDLAPVSQDDYRRQKAAQMRREARIKLRNAHIKQARGIH